MRQEFDKPRFVVVGDRAIFFSEHDPVPVSYTHLDVYKRQDKTYTLKSEYIGRKDATFETSGIYHIIGDSIMELVTPSSGEKTYYRMLNNRQVMLSDKEGTISQSLLAEHYILNKK